MGVRAVHVLLPAGLVGCGTSPSLELPAWQLSLDGREGTRSVGLSAHFDDERISDERLVYRLRATTSVPPAWRAEPLQLVVIYVAHI